MKPYRHLDLAASLGSAANTASVPSLYTSQLSKKAKYTVEEVIMIKLFYHVAGLPISVIAKKYETNTCTINNIIKKKTYKTVALNFMTKIPAQFHEETNNKYIDYKIHGSK